jgi:hypothetical protein
LKSSLLRQIPIVLGFLLVAAPAVAQPIPSHPEAGRAISDLRVARDILSRPGRGGNRQADMDAVALIDKVIESTQRVMDFDQRRFRFQEDTNTDASAQSPSRLENAHIMLTAAAHDLNLAESNLTSRPYLEQARRQLGEASELIRRQQMRGH